MNTEAINSGSLKSAKLRLRAASDTALGLPLLCVLDGFPRELRHGLC
jgi:hypothetical protein